MYNLELECVKELTCDQIRCLWKMDVPKPHVTYNMKREAITCWRCSYPSAIMVCVEPRYTLDFIQLQFLNPVSSLETWISALHWGELVTQFLFQPSAKSCLIIMAQWAVRRRCYIKVSAVFQQQWIFIFVGNVTNTDDRNDGAKTINNENAVLFTRNASCSFEIWYQIKMYNFRQRRPLHTNWSTFCTRQTSFSYPFSRMADHVCSAVRRRSTPS